MERKGRTMARNLARLLCVCVCVTLAFMNSYDAEARGKKKGKEPELAISKRGKLIFEDDFSGKDLEWNFEAGGEWKVVKGRLVRELNNPAGAGSAFRSFPPVEDAIFEIKVYMPLGAYPGLQIDRSARFPCARLSAGQGQGGAFGLEMWDGTRSYYLSQVPLPYNRPRWLQVVFEMLGTRYALTVDGKTVTAEAPAQNERSIRSIYIAPGYNVEGQFLSIDDVKVYEALPKDEDEDKGEKKK